MPQRFRFDGNQYGPALAAWVEVDRCRPLADGLPVGDFDVAPLAKVVLADLFAPAEIADRRAAEACVAGLWLLYDQLDASHAVSQSLETVEGSFWHGILHRREGDFSNAKYWFRRVGVHAIGAPLADEARRLAAEAGRLEWATALLDAGRWNPAAFVDACEGAACGGSHADFCRKVQQSEWELLFDHCYRRATRARVGE